MLWVGLALTASPTLMCGDARDTYRDKCCSRPATTPMLDACRPTHAAQQGGTLYATRNVSAGWESVTNLADAALDAGCRPASKPHMVVPHVASGLVAVTYTADAMAHVLDRTSRAVRACLSTEEFPGSKIHAAHWHEEGEQLFLLLVDMTGSVGGHAHGGVHKFAVDKQTGAGTYVASISTHAETRSATKPIALGGRGPVYFVTDAKGGGAFVDASASMHVVAQADPAAFGRCADGGGLWVESHPTDPARAVAQYGRQAANASCLVEVDLAAARVTRVLALPSGAVDAHGVQFCAADGGDLYLLNSNRVSATFDVLHYETGELVDASSDLDLNGILRGLVPAYAVPPPHVSNVHLTATQVTFDYSDIAVQTATGLPHADGEGHFHVYVAPADVADPLLDEYKEGRAYAGALDVNVTRWVGTEIVVAVAAMTNDHHFYSADGARTAVAATVTVFVAPDGPAVPPLLPASPPPPAPPPPPASGGGGGMRRRRTDDASAPVGSADVLQPDVMAYSNGTVYLVGRGPSPVSAVLDFNFVSSAVPGLYTFALHGCTRLYRAPTPPLPVEYARTVHTAPDPHGGYLVTEDEFWLVDQAPTGAYAQCPGHAAVYLDASVL